MVANQQKEEHGLNGNFELIFSSISVFSQLCMQPWDWLGLVSCLSWIYWNFPLQAKRVGRWQISLREMNTHQPVYRVKDLSVCLSHTLTSIISVLVHKNGPKIFLGHLCQICHQKFENEKTISQSCNGFLGGWGIYFLAQKTTQTCTIQKGHDIWNKNFTSTKFFNFRQSRCVHRKAVFLALWIWFPHD